MEHRNFMLLLFDTPTEFSALKTSELFTVLKYPSSGEKLVYSKSDLCPRASFKQMDDFHLIRYDFKPRPHNATLNANRNNNTEDVRTCELGPCSANMVGYCGYC